MNDKKWAYKTKYRVAKALFFTLLFHALLVLGFAMSSGEDWQEWIPDFLKKELPAEQAEQTPVA